MVSEIASIASIVGQDWVDGEYYDWAEASMESQWQNVIWPVIAGSDFANVLEIAAGHGRNTAKLAELSGRILATDINETNIRFMRKRFESNGNICVELTNGADLRVVPSSSISFVYCFDAMVHFDSDVVRSYLKEIRRVLRPGGRAFCHYSAFDKNPTGTYRTHPGWRNFMSQALFEHWVTKEGMTVLRSSYVMGVSSLTDDPDGSDSVTYFEVPADAKPGDVFVDPEEVLAGAQGQIAKLNEGLARKDAELSGVAARLYAIEEVLAGAQGQIAKLNEELARKDKAISEQNAIAISKDAELTGIAARLYAIENSTSWRLTAPLRRCISWMRGVS